jgi:hypothetical protein
MGLLNLSSAKRESDGYFKKAKDFAFLKTQALEENFLCVLARKFGGRAIPNHLSPSGNRTDSSELEIFQQENFAANADKFERARIWRCRGQGVLECRRENDA